MRAAAWPHELPKRARATATMIAEAGSGSCPAAQLSSDSGIYAVCCGFLFATCSLLTLYILTLKWAWQKERTSGQANEKSPLTTETQNAREAKPTDGTAPKVGSLSEHDKMPIAGASTYAPPSVNETASPTTLMQGEETGSLIDAASAERLTSALALTQRVRDLGLHLGDVVVSGISVGLPNGETGRAIFDSDNMQSLMRGDNLISELSNEMLQAQLERNIVQISKSSTGQRIRKPLHAVEELIKLASRVGELDLNAEYGISPAVCETLDTTYALAVAAGLEALQNAGLVEPPPTKISTPPTATDAADDTPPVPTSATGNPRKEGSWRLPKHLRDETGVIFAASFPALDSLVEELAKHLSAKLSAARASVRSEWLEEVSDLVARRQAKQSLVEGDSCEAETRGSGAASAALTELSEWLVEQCSANANDEASTAVAGYEFNRKLLFKLLVMANSQLAEIVQAKGPNLHINAACAGTTAAIALAHDWIRAGRAKRVVVISADNPSSEHLLPWVGIGFLALGAACTKPHVSEAALPFDRRRSGMLLGAGAVGLVLEADTTAACCHPGRPPLSSILAVRHANSAYHASAIGVSHACELLDALLRDVEVVHGLSRVELVHSGLLYVSHETFTCARNGGCAGAEVTALKAAFGEDGIRRLLITNTKGITGHAMGVCFEDVVAVAALNTGLAPPVVNHKEEDPVLGTLRLSRGGRHECKYALHFAAGFGSQVTYVLYRR